jgi:hypothetical protein
VADEVRSTTKAVAQAAPSEMSVPESLVGSELVTMAVAHDVD